MEALLSAHYVTTMHTYCNTIFSNNRKYLLRAGVPEGCLWLFKRKLQWGEVAYDLTKAG